MEESSNSLSEIENELKDLSSRQKKNWQRIVYLLITVQKNGMYLKKHETFTEWLRAFAAEVGLHEATFWRYFSAGSYYLEKTGESVEQIEKVAVSPKKLEIVKRIEEHAPILGEDLFKKVVTDDPNMTTRFLTKTWEKVRDGKTQEDSKAQELQPTIDHLVSEFKTLTEQDKLSLFSAILESVAARGARDILDRAIIIYNESKATR